MNKIPTLFVRDENNRKYVTDEVTPGCEWVLAGEGVATRKYDGTCMLLDGSGRWWQRREVKKDKPTPDQFMRINFDEVTGKQVGWVPVEPQGYFHPFLEALGVNTKEDWRDLDAAIRTATTEGNFETGTYELCGPKINGNPEQTKAHQLIKHSDAEILWTPDVNHDVEAIKVLVRYLGQVGKEGIVWHHPDGRMVKLKARDLPNE